VIEEKGYIPNNSARNLKRSETKTIAVLVKGMSNPFFGNMIRDMGDEIRKKKFTMVLHHIEFEEDEVEVALELIKEKRLRGIIFLGGYFKGKENRLIKIPIPYVLSTVGGIPEHLDKTKYSSVGVWDVQESYKAVEYLIKAGHRKIAIFTSDESKEGIGLLRLEGYKNALTKYKIKINPRLIRNMKEEIEYYSMENGFAMMQELLQDKEEFTAVYAIADTLAIGAMKALSLSGKKIPEDYSVVGFDGIDMGKYFIPSLTTLSQPMEKISSETTKLLFQVIMGKEVHKHCILEGSLIIRDSSRTVL